MQVTKMQQCIDVVIQLAKTDAAGEGDLANIYQLRDRLMAAASLTFMAPMKRATVTKEKTKEIAMRPAAAPPLAKYAKIEKGAKPQFWAAASQSAWPLASDDILNQAPITPPVSIEDACASTSLELADRYATLDRNSLADSVVPMCLIDW